MCGASVLLSDASVLDPAFWSAVREHRVTSLHGVPHIFELLDHAGFAEMAIPDLRYLTQAGGRLAPDQVRRWAPTSADLPLRSPVVKAGKTARSNYTV